MKKQKCVRNRLILAELAGFVAVVLPAYDGPFGEVGATIVSRHKTYQAAEKSAARRDPSGSWLQVAWISDVLPYIH